MLSVGAYTIVDRCVPTNRTVYFCLPFVGNEVCHLKNIFSKKITAVGVATILAGFWVVNFCAEAGELSTRRAHEIIVLKTAGKKVFVRSEVVWFHKIPCSSHIPVDTGMSAFHYTDVFLPAYHPPIHHSLDHHCGYCVLAWYTWAHHSHICHSCNVPRSPCMDIFFLRLFEPEDDDTAVLWNRNCNPNSTM